MENKLQVGVKILLKNKVGKFLLVGRSKEKYPDKENPWDIVGGRINQDENLLTALSREIKEEVGLELVAEPSLVAAQDIFRDDGVHIVRLTYLGEAEGEVKLDLAENSEYQWLSWPEIVSLKPDLNKYLQAVLDKIEKRL